MSDQTQHEENLEPLSGRASLLHDIGQQLRQAREAKNEAIHKPVRKLKIPVNHIEALESGNWDALPDDVYVIGFLRQYSTYLNIDLSDEINRLKNSDYSLTKPLTFPDPPVAPSRRWAWLSGGAFVLLFIIFNITNTNHIDEEVTQPHADAPEAASVVTSKATSENTITAASRQPATPYPAPETLPQPAQLASIQSETQTIPTMKPASISKTNTIKPSDALVAVNTPIEPTPTNSPRRHTFRFEAVTAPVWIQIFAPNRAGNGKGRLIKEMLLKKGHHSNIRRRTESLWITCGNALALRIKVDKKTVVDTGKLGAGKKVLRDYHFDLNRL